MATVKMEVHLEQRKNSYSKKILYYGSILFLLLYTFRKVNQGIDVTDTGYHFSNFLYMSEMDPMWIFSTYLASVLGHLFTLLPGGNTLLGINIYTSLIPALTGVVTFVFLIKVVKMRWLEAFAGVLAALALCWCPTTCVYNYLTFLFFGAGAMLLYMGLVQEKAAYLILAGVCLGVNVLVRFPNAAEAALIVVVWYTCFLRKNTIKEYLQKTGWCLLGYVLGLGVVFVQIGIQYGIGEYVNGIIRLLGMTGDASDYTLYAMIYNLIQAYLFSGKWVLIMAVCVGLGILGFLVLPGKFTPVKCIGYAACCLVLVRWFYGQGMFSLAYDGYGSIFNWGAVIIILALLMGLWLVISPKASGQDKILSAIVIVVIGITPLGSNNQLYANLNNMFLVAPFVFYVLGKLLFGAKEKVISFKKYTCAVSAWPLIIMVTVCSLMMFWQSLYFGHVFVFRDGVPRDSQVTNIPAVIGMKTNAEIAQSLEELGTYVTEQGLKGRDVLLFGDVPALSAYLEMPFVMSPWPDLASYSNATFEAELEKVIAEIDRNRPVLIFGGEFYKFLTNQVENEEKNNTYEAKYGFKTALLRDMIKENNYTNTFKNEDFVIYE